jgi:hypothetical protein
VPGCRTDYRIGVPDQVTKTPCGARPPYARPADDRRPHGSNRFDVFSLKAGRRLTLFGWGPLWQWVLLEADPSVTDLCERPLAIPDTRPRRVVDFWAASGPSDRLILLIRSDDPISGAKRRAQLAAFVSWAAEGRCTVEERLVPEMTTARRNWLDNWIGMLQHCSSYRVPGEALDCVGSRLREPMSIGQLIDTAVGDGVSLDRDSLRVAVYELVRRGCARIPDLEAARLSDAHLIEPA